MILNSEIKHKPKAMLEVTTDLVLDFQKEPTTRDVFFKKRCCENMQQIYSRTPMPKCDFKGLLLDDTLYFVVV